MILIRVAHFVLVIIKLQQLYGLALLLGKPFKSSVCVYVNLFCSLHLIDPT